MSQLVNAEYLPFAPLDPHSTLLYLVVSCESLTSVGLVNGYVHVPNGFQLALADAKPDWREEGWHQDVIPLTPPFKICLKPVVLLKGW